MRIEVRYFASLVDLTGTQVETVEIPSGIDVTGLWSMLVARHPGLARASFRPLAACDLEYASWARALDGVREVAFLPPVSGG